jgi:hypothetical protein
MNWKEQATAPFVFYRTMRLYAIIFVLLFFASCGGKKIMYAKYGKLKVAENEVNKYPVTNQEVQEFDACCYTEVGDVFLNRVIHDNEGRYGIYISVSESIMQSEFGALQKSDSNIQVLENKTAVISKIKTDGYFLKKNEAYIARFTYMETKSGILVIYDFASTDESVAKSCYDNMTNYLDEKIRL